MRADNYIAEIERREREASERAREERRAAYQVQTPGAGTPRTPGADDVARAAAATDLRLRILDLERRLTGMRVDLRQLQALVDEGHGQYGPALAAKKAQTDALEAQVNALHAQKV